MGEVLRSAKDSAHGFSFRRARLGLSPGARGEKESNFHTQVKVTGCGEEGVTIEPGGLMPTATMIWAGGIRTNPVVESAAVAAGKQGRLVVDATLRLPSHPEVLVAGDCSLALNPSTNQPLPATAQLALQEGRWAAVNILRVLASEEPTPFDPASRGEVVSLGHDRAVGWTRVLGDRQVKLRGLVGGLAKRAAEAEWEVHLWRETHHLDDIFA